MPITNLKQFKASITRYWMKSVEARAVNKKLKEEGERIKAFLIQKSKSQKKTDSCYTIISEASKVKATLSKEKMNTVVDVDAFLEGKTKKTLLAFIRTTGVSTAALKKWYDQEEDWEPHVTDIPSGLFTLTISRPKGRGDK